MAIQKGTGFTNLNRIMQANKGNKLGETVSSGIKGQVEGVKTQVKSAQDQFNEEAQKNRVDTDEAKQARDQIVGRFDTNNYKPDESKFQVSSGLQTNYDQQKQGLLGQQTAFKTQSDQSRAAIQTKLDADRAARTALENKPKNTNIFANARAANELEGYKASTNSLQGLLTSYDTTAKLQSDAIAKKITDLESTYGKMTAAEKTAFMKSETDKLMAANAPTDSEIDQFTKYRTGVYSGPTGLEDAATLTAKASQTQQLGNLARTQGGPQELLRRFVTGGRDKYTQGQQQLDASLLGQDANSVRQAARSTRGLTDQVTGANQQASNLAKEFTGRAQIFGQETQNKLSAAKTPFSQQVDAQVKAAQDAEVARQSNLTTYQSILAGTDPKYEGMDQWTRTGLALQDAANKGYLAPTEVEALMGGNGKSGLLQRSANLGLDVTKLLSERMQGVGAQNINRAGVASDVDVARLNALDKLSGKTGTDLEFLENRARYDDGGITLGGDLESYIARLEAEKGITSPTLDGGSIPEETALSRAKAGVGGYLGSGLDALKGTAELGLSALDPSTTLSPSRITTDASGIVNSVGQGGISGANAVAQTPNAILQGIINMNVGGKSIAKTPAGEQLLRALQQTSSLTNTAAGLAGNALQSSTDSFTKLGQGNIGGSIDSLISGGTNALNTVGDAVSRSEAGKIAGNVSKAVGTALSGGKTGNWATNEFNTIDAETGKKVKIGSFANKSSDTILKQIIDKQLNRATARGNSGNEGAKAINELLKYYNAALEREGKTLSDENLKENIDYSDKDVQKFMDRIKPAAYDYKDEVKDNPLASKNRELGVMAQDLEKSDMGKEAVHDTKEGKIVDYDNLKPKMLASIAALNKRLNELERKK